MVLSFLVLINFKDTLTYLFRRIYRNYGQNPRIDTIISNSQLSVTEIFPIAQNGGLGHSLAVSDTLLFVGGYRHLQIFEASTPNYQELIGEFVLLSQKLRSIYVSGQYVYAACGNAGLLIFDVSHPAQPRQIGHYPYNGLSDVVVQGDFAFISITI